MGRGLRRRHEPGGRVACPGRPPGGRRGVLALAGSGYPGSSLTGWAFALAAAGFFGGYLESGWRAARVTGWGLSPLATLAVGCAGCAWTAVGAAGRPVPAWLPALAGLAWSAHHGFKLWQAGTGALLSLAAVAGGLWFSRAVMSGSQTRTALLVALGTWYALDLARASAATLWTPLPGAVAPGTALFFTAYHSAHAISGAAGTLWGCFYAVERGWGRLPARPPISLRLASAALTFSALAHLLLVGWTFFTASPVLRPAGFVSLVWATGALALAATLPLARPGWLAGWLPPPDGRQSPARQG